MHSSYKEVKIPFPALPRVQRGAFFHPWMQKFCLGPSPLGAPHSVGSGPRWEGREKLVGSERINPTLCLGLTPTHLCTGLDPCAGGLGGLETRRLRTRELPWSSRGTEDEMEQFSLTQGFCTGRAQGMAVGTTKTQPRRNQPRPSSESPHFHLLK